MGHPTQQGPWRPQQEHATKWQSLITSSFPYVMKYHLPFIEFLETDNLRLKDIFSMTALNLGTFNTFMDFVNS